MRTSLILVLLLSAQPAFAACHRYSKWLYPWPQSCRATPTHMQRARLEQAPPPPAAIPDIDPILIPPDFDEQQERREAINKLKEKMSDH
jgi:hypothetical protein